MVGRAVLVEPRVDERHVDCPPHAALPEVERSRGPIERDARGRGIRVERHFLEYGSHFLWQGELLILLPKAQYILHTHTYIIKEIHTTHYSA